MAASELWSWEPKPKRNNMQRSVSPHRLVEAQSQPHCLSLLPPSSACRLVADMSTRRCCHLTQCRLPRSPADGDHVTLDSESPSPPPSPSLSASLCNSLTAFSHAVDLLHATRLSRLVLPGTSSFLLLLPLNLSSTNSFKMVSVLRKILFFYNFSSALIC